MFLIHSDVLEPFSIFSKYTPLKPLLTQANNTAPRPTNAIELFLFAVDSPLGHCKQTEKGRKVAREKRRERVFPTQFIVQSSPV